MELTDAMARNKTMKAREEYFKNPENFKRLDDILIAIEKAASDTTNPAGYVVVKENYQDLPYAIKRSLWGMGFALEEEPGSLWTLITWDKEFYGTSK